MHWYVEVLKKYAVFRGRARRKEYWLYTLVNLVVSIVLAIVDRLLGTDGRIDLISGVYGLLVLVPTLAVTVRRLHDTDRSGWWILLNLFPVVGWLVVLVFNVMDGTPGPNRHGADPKSPERSASAVPHV
ncbi:DUF805 domain-containing protein [Kribbella sp. NPDC051587]|uniref:DUF805 domain-containing protein n=1 Tax=Kribbella sp. NPDC051587 TaxID=3364119 RepID=UPI0037A374BF